MWGRTRGWDPKGKSESIAPHSAPHSLVHRGAEPGQQAAPRDASVREEGEKLSVPQRCRKRRCCGAKMRLCGAWGPKIGLHGRGCGSESGHKSAWAA